MSTAASGRLSPAKTYTMKDLEQQISELKKENFGLKLRIYYMEEKMGQNYENDDNIKTNIELKVEAEHLKRELMDKDQLLLKASQAVECLAQEKETLLKKQDDDVSIQQLHDQLKEKDEEIDRMKDLEHNLQTRLEEAKERKDDLEKAVEEKCEERDAVVEDKRALLAEKDREIGELQRRVHQSENTIKNLREENAGAEERTIQDLRADNDEMKRHLEQTENQAKEQFAQILKLEETLRATKGELEAKDEEKKDLENQLRSSQLAEMEASKALLLNDQEKRTLENNAQKSYMAIQKFVPALRDKDKEIRKLKEELADKEKEIDDARDTEARKYDILLKDLHHQLAEAKNGASKENKDIIANYEAKLAENLAAIEAAEAEKAELKDLLKNKENDIEELDEGLREQRQKYQELEDRMKDADAENKQLTGAVNSQIKAKEIEVEQLKQSLDDKDDIISSMKQSLEGKEAMVENLQDLLEGQSKDDLFKQLAAKLKDKEKQIQEIVAERAEVARANEKTTRDMLDAIRDKDEQIKELNSDLSHQAIEHNNKIHALQRELENKDLELKGAGDALSLAEQDQDNMVGQLKKALEDKDRAIEKLMESGREKDKLFLDMQQASLHPGADVETLKGEVEELKEALTAKEDELRHLRSSRPEKGEVDSLMSELQHKNKLLQRARTTIDQLQQPSDSDQYEVLKQKRKISDLESELDEKQRKLDDKIEEGKENERLLKELRVRVNLAESHQGRDSCSEDIHDALKEQVRELSKLTDVLKAERQLYVNITQSGSSREAELATIQALCSHLVQGLNRRDDPRPSDTATNGHFSDVPSHRGSHHDGMSQTERSPVERSVTPHHGVQESHSASQVENATRPSENLFATTAGSSWQQPLQQEQSIEPSENLDTIMSVSPQQLGSQQGKAKRHSESLSPLMSAQQLPSQPRRTSRSSIGRSVLGQENSQVSALQQKITALEGEVASKNLEIESLRQCLQDQLRDRAGDQVVPILKQQLDQAKTLLAEKDSQLQSMQRECQIKTGEANDLKGQNDHLKEVNEKLTSKMDVLSREIPHLKSQLEKAHSLSRKQKRENLMLREKLGIGVNDDPVRTIVDTLEVANAKLQAEVDELCHRTSTQDMDNLQRKLKTAENMNDLLRKHIALNTPKDPDTREFDPTLIVDLAQEIERLEEQLKKAGISQQQRDSTARKDALTSIQEQLARCQRELKEALQSKQQLQQKLHATEGTVHLQADRIQRYRRQLHNLGMSPAATPKRVQSDSNLSRSRFGRQASEIEILRSSNVDENSYADFGDSDDVAELKEQVEVLKNETGRCHRLVRSFQSQSTSRSSTPSRSLSPERDTSGWFQMMSSQGSIAKLQQEVESLKLQLQQANELNATIHEQYKDIHTEIEQAHTADLATEQLKAKERDITLLLGYLEESKKLSDLMKQMLLEALRTMEDIKQTHGSLENRNMVEQLNLAQDRLKSGVDIAESLHRALDEYPSDSGSSGTSPTRKKSSFAESLKKKLKEIAALKRELSRCKKRNQSMSRLLEENQSMTEETSQELKKLAGDVLHKQKTIAKLQQELHEMKRERELTSVSTQTSPLAGDDLSQLYAKLRENQLLVCTLKSELQVYRDVLHAKTPEKSPHSVGGRSDTEDTLRAYLEELKSLRKKLEDSIKENDRLRKQLQENLAGQAKDGVPHIQETNIHLTTRVETLNIKLREKDQMNQKLKEDCKKMKTELLRMKTENQRLVTQLDENAQLQTSLRFELSAYEQMHPKEQGAGARLQDPKTGIDLTEILSEMRRLRIQLERSIDTNNALRAKLEEMTASHWSTDRHLERRTKTTHHSRKLFVNADAASDTTEDMSPYEDTQYYDMPAALGSGEAGAQFMVSSLQTFEALKKALRECKSLLSLITTSLQKDQQELRPFLHKVSLLVDEANLHLTKFSREQLPRSEEIRKLRRQIVAQRKLMNRLSNSQSRDMEDVIVKKLMEHEATLVKAHRNLEAKQMINSENRQPSAHN